MPRLVFERDLLHLSTIGGAVWSFRLRDTVTYSSAFFILPQGAPQGVAQARCGSECAFFTSWRDDAGQTTGGAARFLRYAPVLFRHFEPSDGICCVKIKVEERRRWRAVLPARFLPPNSSRAIVNYPLARYIPEAVGGYGRQIFRRGILCSKQVWARSRTPTHPDY